MIIAVDIGNSNIVIGGIQDTEILFEARLCTDATKTSDEYAIDLKMLFEIHSISLANIEGSIISGYGRIESHWRSTAAHRQPACSGRILPPGGGHGSYKS